MPKHTEAGTEGENPFREVTDHVARTYEVNLSVFSFDELKAQSNAVSRLVAV